MSNILKDTLNKQPLICAEGYLFEMERRGYLTSGEFVPEVALEHPEVLENLHKLEFNRNTLIKPIYISNNNVLNW